MVVGSPARLRAQVTVKLVCVITGDEFAGYASVTPGELTLQMMAADAHDAPSTATPTAIQRRKRIIGRLPGRRGGPRARSRPRSRAQASRRTCIPDRSISSAGGWWAVAP